MAQKSPNDSLVVISNSLIIVDQSSDCISVKNIPWLFNLSSPERGVMPVCRANVKTFLKKSVRSGWIAVMEFKGYVVILHSVIWHYSSVIHF